MKKILLILILFILIINPLIASAQYTEEEIDDTEFIAYSKKTFRFYIDDTEIVISDVYEDGAELTQNRTYNIDVGIGDLKRNCEVMIVKDGAIEKTTVPLDNKYEDRKNVILYEHETLIITPKGFNVTFEFIYRNETSQETFLTLIYIITDRIILEDGDLYNLLKEREDRRKQIELEYTKYREVLVSEQSMFGWISLAILLTVMCCIFGFYYGGALKTRGYMLPSVPATWDFKLFIVLCQFAISLSILVSFDHGTLTNLFQYEYIDEYNIRSTMASPYEMTILGMHVLIIFVFNFCFWISHVVGFRRTPMPDIINQQVDETDLEPALMAQGYILDISTKPHAFLPNSRIVVPLTERVGLKPNGDVDTGPLRFRDQARRLIWGVKRACPEYIYLYPERMMRYAYNIRVQGAKGTILNTIYIKRKIDLPQFSMMEESYLGELFSESMLEDIKGVKTEEELIERRLKLKAGKYNFVKRWWEKKRIIAELNKLVMVFVPARGLGNTERILSDRRIVELSSKNADKADEMMAVHHKIRETDQALPAGVYIANTDTTPLENIMDEEELLRRDAEENREYWKKQRDRIREEEAEGEPYGS